MNQEKEPLLVINPRFNAIYYFLNKHFFTLVALIFLMIMSLQLGINAEYNLNFYFLISIAIYIVYIFVKGFMTKRQYNRIQYAFYDDRVIIIDNRKGRNDAVIYYNETYDILMNQDYIQKFFNQGNLVFKLSEAKVFAKNYIIFGIGNYDKTTQELATIIFGDQQPDENI